MKRKLENTEEEEYWAFIEKTAKRVETYPDWKRGGQSAGKNQDDEEKNKLCNAPHGDIHLSLT